MLGIVIQNCIVFLLLAALCALCVWFVRQPYWPTVRRSLVRNKVACLSFVVLCLYAAAGVCDSIVWREPLTDGLGNPIATAEGKPLYQATPLSLLDRLCTPIRSASEKTYSAPLATVQLTLESVQLDNGTIVRTAPPLTYPGRHLLGTDKVGQDVLYSTLKGIRTALIIGVFTSLIAIPFALLFGIVAGFFGRLIDDVVQYVYTTLMSIPSILLMVAFMLLFGRGLTQLCIIMGITTWTGLCRLIRAESIKLRELEYIAAAEALGVPRLVICARHILPNVMHIVIISAVLNFSGLVLSEAILSYIGIGVGPETGSWGNMINNARLELARAPVVWWNLAGAFIGMLGLVLPANLFGDALRDALDPRMKG
jgi:peptide/nickel transport system permease protein